MDHPARPREALTSPGREPIEQTSGRFCLLSCISNISWFIVLRCLARKKPDFHRHDHRAILILLEDRWFLKIAPVIEGFKTGRLSYDGKNRLRKTVEYIWANTGGAESRGGGGAARW
jgi:hypothetical protein